jgi:hypothetical protein
MSTSASSIARSRWPYYSNSQLGRVMELNNGNTSIPRNTCTPQNRRISQALLSPIASSTTKLKPKFLFRLSNMHLPTRLRGRISNLIIHHHVLVSALCRNPDFWLLLLVQMWSHVMWSEIGMMIQQLYDMRFQRVALISAGTC